jgi:hypothetical protein
MSSSGRHESLHQLGGLQVRLPIFARFGYDFWLAPLRALPYIYMQEIFP